MVVAVTVEGAVREIDPGDVIRANLAVVPAKAGTHAPRPRGFGQQELILFANSQRRWLQVPAFAGTTEFKSCR